MPIETNFYGSIQAPDILGGFEKGMSLRQLAQQNKLRQAQMDENDAIKSAFAKNTVTGADGKTTLNRSATLSDLYKASPLKAMEVESNFTTQEREAQKNALEKRTSDSQLIAQLAGSVTDQPSYERAIESAKKFGLDTTSLPPQYDPALVKSLRMTALPTKDQFDQEWKQKELDLKNREVRAKEIEAGAKKSEGSGKVAGDLRKERSGLPLTKATGEISAAYNKIQSAAQNPSPAGDMSLIFGYMKMLDPASTVREGEVASAQQAAGVPTQVLNMYNRALKGERLAPEQRADFVNQAGGLYKSQLALQKQVDAQFQTLAERAGVDPKDVILNFEANQKAGLTRDEKIAKLNKLAGK